MKQIDRIVIDHDLYGERTEFADIHEAEKTIRELGNEFSDVELAIRGYDVVNETGVIVGKLIEKIQWTFFQAMLCDSDGNHPDDEYFREAMIRFRDEGGIQGYWFCDISNRNENDLCWDEWNQAWDEDFRCGPSVDEIDFTGLE